MRKLALLQSVISFIFNLAILGLSVNVGAGLLNQAVLINRQPGNATSLLMLMSSVHAKGLTTSAADNKFTVSVGWPTIKQVLHCCKMYDKKPFPDAQIYYYDNGT